MLGWNEAHDDAAVQPSDRIQSVNGATTPEGMAQELKKKDTIELVIMRYPEEFEISVSKKAGDGSLKKLGLTYEKPAEGQLQQELKVKEVKKDGLVWTSNQAQAESRMFHQVVLTGMRIVQVNSIVGDANLMREELKNAEDVTIRLRRSEVYALRRDKALRQAKILAAFTSLSQPPSASASS